MNWLNALTTTLDVARLVMSLAVNWMMQSTLLIACGLVVGHWLRHRGSAVQSAVYRTTLVAALVCPLATWGLSLCGVTGWSLDMPTAYALDSAPAEIEPSQHAVHEAQPLPTGPTSAIENQFASPELDAPLTGPSLATPDSTVFGTPLPVPEISSAQSVPSAVPAQATSSSVAMRSFAYIASAAAALWIVVTTWLCSRLVTAWRQLHRLRRGAKNAETETIEACQQVAARMSVAPPEVLCSPFLPSPCLAGLRRPAVMLPEADLNLPMRDVLVHELAHLVRHDCFWNLLRQSATALMFFQPLLWVLSRRLAATAEEVCDDYVVQYGGDRREYAHRLVDIATLSVAPLATAGVGIVSFRSMLAARVARIMDTSRSLSTRAGSLALAIVLVVGMAATLLVGLVGLNPAPVAADAAEKPAQDSAAVSSGEDSDSKDKSNAKSADDTQVITGRVIGPDGKAVPGATVFASWVFSGGEWPRAKTDPSHENEHVIVAQTKSRDDGTFELQVATKSPREGHLSESWHIAAFAPGFGAAWRRDVQVKKGEPTTLNLTNSKPILGRIVDLEGKPVAGVKVRVHQLRPAKSEQALNDWIAAARKKSALAEIDGFIMASMRGGSADEETPGRFPYDWNDGGLGHGSSALPADTQTDQDGRFQLDKLGENRLALLEIESPDVAKTVLQVLTCDAEQFNAMPADFIGVPAGTYYGRKFEFVAAPTQVIEGQVVDADSGEPLLDVQVRVAQFAGNRFSQMDFLSARTDEQGNYKLIGAPQGGGHRIEVTPAADMPYFSAPQTLRKVPASFDPIRADFKLKRGIWVTGKVTDPDSAEPMKDIVVEYLPLRSNEHATHYSH
jgi:beta-lactamase regulating signal transducer with metallopeptidase domain